MRSDRRAASSVVGVVLLVAITVVLAVTVAGFVFAEAGDTPEPPPETAFDFDYDRNGDPAANVPSDELVVTYAGGETLPAERLNVTVTGAQVRDQTGDVVDAEIAFRPNFAGGGRLFAGETVGSGDSDTVTDADFRQAGGNNVLGANRGLDLSTATVRVYWEAPNDETSYVVAAWTGPAA